jgi:hypothetical protein
MGFFQRLAVRRDKQKLRNAKRQEDNKTKANHICDMFEQAYHSWAGEGIKVRYVSGRYYIPGREAGMMEGVIMKRINLMLAQLHENELPSLED